ncbi:sensor histidine kinase [Streptomyces sp. LKA04]|uniref:sensor histidine kinase n=1 Tax=Streptomyces sp. LKA04 TaxID=3398092 RepID=UPI003A808AB6
MSKMHAPRLQMARRPQSLRARLTVASVTLVAVICAVIGTTTTLTLRSHLYGELKGRLSEISARASGALGPPGKFVEDGSPAGPENQDREAVVAAFVTTGQQPSGTITAALQGEKISDVKVGYKFRDDDGVPWVNARDLTAAQSAALETVSRDHEMHIVRIPNLGTYIAVYATGLRGTYYVAIPTEEVDNTVNTLILVEVSATFAGLVAASFAGAAIVGLATRPLRKVAATATRVSETPLRSGDVNLNDRVPEAECNPGSEVGQVGAALNRMLDHVHEALHARQQSEARIRQFVADASHELRTPLTSIRGYAELTRRAQERTGPSTRHALNRIESEADRMTLLVEDLLLLARLDAGRPLEFERTDLIPLIVDTVSDARAAGPDHTWRLDLLREPALVSADPSRLLQVLVNLLGNARNHTPPGTTVTAHVRRSGALLCVDVEDDGPGIPPQLLPHVFERFARGDSARTRTAGSTGLGLAIVQAVTTAHSGNVTVDSRPGRTVFTVELPALSTDSPTADSRRLAVSPGVYSS